MRILHLTLKKQWFDLIASGDKREEYRELKIYWLKRLLKVPTMERSGIANPDNIKQFDIVRFRHGYAKNAPEMDVECRGIDVGIGNPKWGAEPYEDYFTIALGKILSVKNYHPQNSPL
jgi:hypothetical protein